MGLPAQWQTLERADAACRLQISVDVSGLTGDMLVGSLRVHFDDETLVPVELPIIILRYNEASLGTASPNDN